VGRGINKLLNKAGNNVNYKEAAKIANKTGVSVDRVYSKAQNRGQSTSAGATAANAGYTPGAGVTVRPGYVSQSAANAASALEQARAGGGGGPFDGGGGQPTFDWDAWNLQMMEQQAAVWASMDAMNAQFLQQQEEWRASQETQYGPWIKGQRQVINGLNNSDPVQVKRKKRKKASTTAAGTKLSIGGNSSAGGISTGGQSSGKTLGIG
jgi:hypothetical protein